MVRWPGIILLLILGPLLSAQVASDSSPNEVRVQVPLKSLEPAHFSDRIFRENIKGDSIKINILEDEISYLEAQVPMLKFLPAEIQLDSSDMAASLEEALQYTSYPTYEQYVSMMQLFAANYPDICKLDTFGYSVEGRLLLALKISDNVMLSEEEPAFLYTSTMHGDELVGYVLSLRLAGTLLEEYGSDPEITQLIDEIEIWINPLSNPDYTYLGGNHTVADSERANDYDLNRSFPYAFTGSNDTSGILPENKYMMLFLAEHDFNLSANLHGGAEVVNYPWDYTYERHPDDDWFVFISQEYADEARAINPLYMDEFVDPSTGITGITNGADWYVIQGGRQDYVTYFLGGREVTLELSNIKKVSSELLDGYWNLNKWSLINLLQQSRYGIEGKVSSEASGIPLSARITVLDHDNEHSGINTDPASGIFYRFLKEGSYDLRVNSPGYISDTILNIALTDYQKTKLEISLDSNLVKPVKNYLEQQIKLYPNPVQNHLFISSPHTIELQKWNITIYDLSGREQAYSLLFRDQEILGLDLTGLESGIYIISLDDSVNKLSRLIRIQ